MVFGRTDKAIELSVEVEGKETPFFPGDKVNALVTLTTRQGGGVKKLHAGLCFRSRRQTASAKGKDDGAETVRKWSDEEKWLGEETLLGEADLARGLNNTYNLQWTVPEAAAPSYQGEIIKHEYSVRVDLARTEGKDLKEEVELQVAQPAPGRELQAGSYGKVKNSHDANMQFEMSRLEYVEGETLSGRLRVEPKVDIEAKELRLELWRVESVTDGDIDNTNIHKCETHKLAGITILPDSKPAYYDFSIPVKIGGCPTFKQEGVEGSWLLKAVVSRPLATDCEAEQAVYLYRAYRQG